MGRDERCHFTFGASETLYFCRMSLCIHRHADVSRVELSRLSEALATFYQNPPDSYYRIADGSAQRYNSTEQPFHCDLISRITLGTSVLEVGCGTAHLCSFVEQRGGNYTGVDYSSALLRENRLRFPNARFFQIGAIPEETFDLVASLYTVEHVIEPPIYLRQLWDSCRPGGLIGVISPEFIDSYGLPPSLYYGFTPARLREKLKKLAILDAGAHFFDQKIVAALWKRRALASKPGAFWINLKPRVLHGAKYTIDSDAVHLVRRKDLMWYFQSLGGEIVCTSADFPDAQASVCRFNSYVLVQKPLRICD